MFKYFYRIERICHRPTAEDKISIITDVKEDDLQLARLLATKRYTEKIQELKEGIYSPAGYEDYEIKKGISYNYQLIIIDTLNDIQYVVESTMENLISETKEGKLKEREIFKEEGFKYPKI